MNQEQALTRLGINALRETQAEPISSILSGQDTVAALPTGGGKSLIYQLPALMSEGKTTVVISPLKSLQTDQVTHLRQKGIQARLLNSSLADKKRKEILCELRSGKVSLLYIAPEQLDNAETRGALKAARIYQVAVDEAHILAQEQHNFRKAYARIGDFIDSLPERPIVTAFTATATAHDRKIIIQSLGMRNPRTFVEPVRRPNLHLSIKIVDVDKTEDRRSAIWRAKRCLAEDALKKWNDDGSVIVYCPTVKKVKKLYKWLKAEGFKVARYHGKMSDKKRLSAQEKFLSGERPIMVATNAFGLGIDKPDVRMVIHLGLPLTIDGYVQEIGRAGRDGKNAECVLIYSPSDFSANRNILSHGAKKKAAAYSIKRLEALRKLVSSDKCLWKGIEKHFDEKPGKKCDKCCKCLQKKYRKD